MTLPLPPRPPKRTGHSRHAMAAMRANGDVRGWFGLVQKGRPKSTIKLSPSDDDSTVSSLTAASSVSTDASTATTVAAMAAAMDVQLIPRRRRRVNWSTEENFPRLLKGVLSLSVRLEHLAGVSLTTPLTPATTTRPLEASIVLQEAKIHGIPRQMLTRKLEEFTDVAAELGIDLSELKSEDVYEPWRKKPLLDTDKLRFLSNTISYRDHANTGMTRAKIISLMQYTHFKPQTLSAFP